MNTIGPRELLLIVPAIGLLSGANQLPRMAGSLKGTAKPRRAVHEPCQPGNADATHGPGNNTTPER